MKHNSVLTRIKAASSPDYNWRLFILLWGMASFGLLAVLPYVLALQKNTMQTVHLPLPLPVLVSAQLAIQILVIGVLTGLGLWFAKSIGLGAPMLDDLLSGAPSQAEYRYTWLPVVLIGLAVSALVVFLDRLVFNPIILDELQVKGISLPASVNPPVWKGLLASFYGGFTEEILVRLFLMSLIGWVGTRLLPGKTQKPSSQMMWSANILAALAFGLGHLPTAIAIGLPINAWEISRILLLNSLPGLVFGWLYWKRGFGSAMIAHFSGDVLLHVITPLLFFP